MEVKINREIREYTESMFFGLTLRQFIFTVLAAAASIISYFLLRPVIGIEAVSWVCMLTAVPFAVLGFVRYNGMPAEKFICAWIKSEILMPKHPCPAFARLCLIYQGQHGGRAYGHQQKPDALY